MKTVLFVCTGNTCRSPMAEAMFNSIAEKKGLQINATSCGIYGDGVSQISENAKTALNNIGVNFHHISTPIDEELLEKADYIFGITQNHARAVINNFPKYAEKVYSFPTDIDDPYGCDVATYEYCLEEIKNGVEKIIYKL